MAHGLLCLGTMKLLAASTCSLLFLCGPALADTPHHVAPAAPAAPPAPTTPSPSIPPAPPASLNLRFVVHAGAATRIHDVIVTSNHRCASASEKVSDHEDEISVCTLDGAQLDIDWTTRASSSEYRSKATLVLARGATAELGSGSGPRLGVTLQ